MLVTEVVVDASTLVRESLQLHGGSLILLRQKAPKWSIVSDMKDSNAPKT